MGLFSYLWLRLNRRADRQRISERQPAINHSFSMDDHVGNRRRESWWDPIYAPDLPPKMKPCFWQPEDDAGPSVKFIYGPNFTSAVNKGDPHRIRRKTFDRCDFQGVFEANPQIEFQDCHFIECDFAHSLWIDTNFKKCTFEKCSIALARFVRCEFRDVTWEKIGISGSKTDFEKCFLIDAPKLIDAAFSGTRERNSPRRHRMEQWYRLQASRAQLSRTILNCHSEVGDEREFYRIAKKHDLQSVKADFAKDLFNLWYEYKFLKIIALVSSSANFLLMYALGFLNGWGRSILRPLVALLILFLFFMVAYGLFFHQNDYALKSFNITILLGYGNEMEEIMPLGLRLSQVIHAIAAIFLYSILVGTIIAKMSRVR